MSKRFGPPRLKGSTREKWASELFRFGYRKAANDKKIPDRVGSGISVLQKLQISVRRPWSPAVISTPDLLAIARKRTLRAVWAKSLFAWTSLVNVERAAI